MKSNGLLSSVQNSVTGMTAQVRQLDAISKNIANSEKVAKPGEDVYARRKIVYKEVKSFNHELSSANSRVKKTDPRHISMDGNSGNQSWIGDGKALEMVYNKEERKIHDPGNPYADEEGFIRVPDINIVEEMVEMMTLNRSFEANLTAFNTSKQMAKQSLEI